MTPDALQTAIECWVKLDIVHTTVVCDMANTVSVKIKHAGKSYDATVDLDQPGLSFKQQIHQLTGVEPDKVKVVVKGGMLKDDADMKKLGFKQVSSLCHHRAETCMTTSSHLRCTGADPVRIPLITSTQGQTIMVSHVTLLSLLLVHWLTGLSDLVLPRVVIQLCR